MPRALSNKIKRAIAHLASGDARHVKQAAEMVGCTREALSRALQRDDAQAILLSELKRHRSVYSRLRAQRAVDHLAKYAKSEDVKLKAATWIETTLGMGGTRAESQSGGGAVGVGGTIVLNIALKHVQTGQIGAPHAHQTEAIAQIVEVPAQSEPARILAKVADDTADDEQTPGGRHG
ncbi:MAG: hypothetical protein LCH62_19040 [Proteobacteria bacterium]|nr:hypothetical protein [Pseudomonadota bacterium]